MREIYFYFCFVYYILFCDYKLQNLLFLKSRNGDFKKCSPAVYRKTFFLILNAFSGGFFLFGWFLGWFFLVGWFVYLFVFVEYELFVTFVFSLSLSVKISRSYGAVFPWCTSNQVAFDFSRYHCNKNCPSDFKTAENN